MRLFKVVLSICFFFAMTTVSYAENNNPVSFKVMKNFITTYFRAGNGIVISDGVISANPFLKVGDFYQGGVVFYVDNTGQHGLIVSIANQTDNAAWFGACGGASPACPITKATANGVGAGALNTAAMIASQAIFNGAVNSAADIAANTYVESSTGLNPNNICTPVLISEVATLSTTCIGGWYLPSQHELLILLTQAKYGTINAAITAHGGNSIDIGSTFWSSNEIDAALASAGSWTTSFDQLVYDSDGKSDTTQGVRAIRQF